MTKYSQCSKILVSIKMGANEVLFALGKEQKMDLASWFVCLLGIGVVFLGLICLILLCFVIGFFSRDKKKSVKEEAVQTKSATALSAAPTAATSAATVTENRGEIIAAVSAAIAEELGEDVSSIRILSFKKIGG